MVVRRGGGMWEAKSGEDGWDGGERERPYKSRGLADYGAGIGIALARESHLAPAKTWCASVCTPGHGSGVTCRE